MIFSEASRYSLNDTNYYRNTGEETVYGKKHPGFMARKIHRAPYMSINSLETWRNDFEYPKFSFFFTVVWVKTRTPFILEAICPGKCIKIKLNNGISGNPGFLLRRLELRPTSGLICFCEPQVRKQFSRSIYESIIHLIG
jgi:hypothetical protein